MKFIAAALVGALASAVVAAPVTKRQTAITDLDVLQYALTLEHLENEFYKGAISTMPESDFLAAGYSSKFYSDLKYIVHDEEAHVVFLEAAIKGVGGTPVAACEYSFPYTDVKSFLTLASILEGVGVSAYLGAAGSIMEKPYLTAAGAILVTEALHQSFTRYSVGEVPMANDLATPLGFNAVYSLAAAFITSCPSTNAALPVMAYPGLTVDTGTPAAVGVDLMFTTKAALPETFFVTYVSGLDIISVEPTMSGDLIMGVIPEGISGQSYAFITTANVTAITDAVVIAGPAIIEVTPMSPTFDLTIL